MGRIQSSLVLNDRMTAVLRRINNAMSSTIDSFVAVQRASGRSFNTANIAAARREIGAANASLDEMEQIYRDCNKQQEELNRRISKGTQGAGGLMSKIKGIASAYVGLKTVSGAVKLSDTMTRTNARLNMMNGGSQDTADLKKMIFASAQRSRGSYLATADSVAKMGLMAGDAFSSKKEIIDFMEQVNKQFKIAGTNAQGVDAAMLQLTQAMGSGVLRGEEYNSVLEQAPNIIQSIAKYMDVPKGELKDMAAKGKITANIVKAAILDCAGEMDKQFKNMPITWGDIWTSMKNQAVIALEPVLSKISSLANDSKVQQTVSGLIGAFAKLAIAAAGVLGVVSAVYSFMANNWGWISPIIYGIVAAFTAYNAVLLVHNGLLAAQTAIKGIQNIQDYKKAKSILAQAAAHGINTKAVVAEATAHGANTAALTGEAAAAGLSAAGLTATEVATAGATVAQTSFNTALLACPITWVLIAIIAVIAAIYAIIGAINKLTRQTYSATGFIFGIVCWLVSVIWNIVIGLLNGIIQFAWTYFVEPWIGIVEWILNVCNGGFNSFGDAVKNLLGNIISWFLSLGKVVTQIIDAIFGTDWTGGLNSLQNKVLAWGKNDKAITLSREAPTVQSLSGGKIGRWDSMKAFDTGYSAGQKVDAAIGKGFDAMKGGFGDAGAGTPGGALGDIAKNTEDTAKNTGKNSEELSYLRDIAEREAVNRFTTAEIKVDMSGMSNRIENSMDIDGIISYLTNGVAEALETAAEGVY